MTCLNPCSAQKLCPQCREVVEEVENSEFETFKRFYKPEKMKEPKCTLTDEQLVDKCHEWISKLCKTGGAAWTLRVPVDFNHDPDMLFSELIKRFRAAKP